MCGREHVAQRQVASAARPQRSVPNKVDATSTAETTAAPVVTAETSYRLTMTAASAQRTVPANVTNAWGGPPRPRSPPAAQCRDGCRCRGATLPACVQISSSLLPFKRTIDQRPKEGVQHYVALRAA